MSLKIQTALLPQKHIDFSQSLVGIGGFVRALLRTGPKSFDQVWRMAHADDSDWPSKPSAEQVMLAIIILFSIGQLEHVGDGRIGLIG
ncbi:TPA: hypothetical protein QEM95_05495 [Stenotrophomonas maltophilia]|nr:hypothetical protein [Stenotrophomonas maltophilia]